MNQKGAVHRTAQCVLSQGEGCESHANKAEFPCFLLRKLSVTQSAKSVCSELQISHAVGSRNSPLSPAWSGGSCLPPSLLLSELPLQNATVPLCCSTPLFEGKAVAKLYRFGCELKARSRKGRKSLPAQWCGFFWCLPGLIQSSIILSTMLALCTEDSKAGSFKGPAQNKSRCSLILVSSGFYLCFFFFFLFLPSILQLGIYVYSIIGYNGI